MNKYFILLVSAVMIVVYGCRDVHGTHDHEEKHEQETEHGDEIHLEKHQIEAAGIRVRTVMSGDFSSIIKVGGQILPSTGDEQTIVATAAGIVSYDNRLLTEGSAIVAGQRIATISSSNLPDGNPAQKVRAEFVAAEKEYERGKELVGDRIISEKDFAQIQLRYETARVAWQAQAGNVTAKGVSVSSPISGFVKNRRVKQGDYVAVGTPILDVSQRRRLQLRADVSERDFAQLKNISSANFRTSGNTQVFRLQELGGRLLSYGKSTTEGSAYIPVIFEFDNLGDFISGSYAEVWLLTTQRTHVISVPVNALTEEQGVYYVYLQVEDEQGSFVRREVKTGETDGVRVEILDGLDEGEQVVVAGAYQLKLASVSATIPHGHEH